MKSFFYVIQAALLSFALPLLSLANGTDLHSESVDVHDEAVDVAVIDPVVIIGVIGVVLIGAFIIWKFSLQKK